jgi:hypothetical protein
LLYQKIKKYYFLSWNLNMGSSFERQCMANKCHGKLGLTDRKKLGCDLDIFVRIKVGVG